MRYIYIFAFIGIFMLGGCQQDCDKEKALSDIQLLLEKHVIANETKNIDLVKEIWAPKEDIVIFGTDSDEKLMGWTEIQNTFLKQFEMFEEAYLSFDKQKINMNCDGNIGWFSQIMNYNYTTTEGVPKRFEGVRFTGVVERIDDKWYIVQSHMSIPYDSMERAKDIKPPNQ
ncbi:MAG: nuclear transport factor 2 family protein [Bacteroidales bacterium]|nr:nuclear transport factor 2 family protein [Bacteroidales bacterium]